MWDSDRSFSITQTTRRRSLVWLSLIAFLATLLAPFMVIAWHSGTFKGFIFATWTPGLIIATTIWLLSHILSPVQYTLEIDSSRIRVNNDTTGRELFSGSRAEATSLRFSYDDEISVGRFIYRNADGPTDCSCRIYFGLTELSELQAFLVKMWPEVEHETTAEWRRPAPPENSA